MGCGWPGSDDHADWMTHLCQRPIRFVVDLPGWDERARIAAVPGGAILANPKHELVRVDLAQDLFDQAEASLERQRVLPNEPAIQQAVDDWLLMERKARAWDELVQRATSCDITAAQVLALEDILVHPAREPSTR